METLKQFLNFLDGKKTTIAVIIGYLVVFCLGRGYITQDLADLISGIMVALGLSANIAKYKMNQ